MQSYPDVWRPTALLQVLHAQLVRCSSWPMNRVCSMRTCSLRRHHPDVFDAAMKNDKDGLPYLRDYRWDSGRSVCWLHRLLKSRSDHSLRRSGKGRRPDHETYQTFHGCQYAFRIQRQNETALLSTERKRCCRSRSQRSGLGSQVNHIAWRLCLIIFAQSPALIFLLITHRTSISSYSHFEKIHCHINPLIAIVFTIDAQTIARHYFRALDSSSHIRTPIRKDKKHRLQIFGNRMPTLTMTRNIISSIASS